MTAEIKVSVSPSAYVDGAAVEEAVIENQMKRADRIRRRTCEADTLKQLLVSNQEMIQQLTRKLAGMEDSHAGASRLSHPTPRQQAVQKELDEARSRYKDALKKMAEERG